MINLNKPCEIEDFDNLELVETIRSINAHEAKVHGPAWPKGREMRKIWETGMAVLAMRHLRILRPEAMVLGVAAGIEPTIFYLTNHVRWVFATDLYATPGNNWEYAAPPKMLTEPEGLSPIPFRPGRLVTQHMDARRLRYEACSFDAVFSSSSIEHFGSWDAVAMAAREMARVLKPGGLLTLSTEYRIAGPGKGPSPNVFTFDSQELLKLIVEPSGLSLLSEPQFTISDRTRSVVVPENELIANLALVRGGREANWRTFPHLVLQTGQYCWTSYHLALTKS